MEDKISNLVTGFRKSHGTQYFLVLMLKNGNKLSITANVSL